MYLAEAKTKFYHASPKRLNVGAVLVPGKGNKDKIWQQHAVFLTTKPLPHHTILKHAVREDWHVYEVRPIGKVHKGIWDDIEADRAEVVKYVGKARGIVNSHKKKTKYDKRTKAYRKNLSKDYPEDDWSDEFPNIGSAVGRGEFRRMKKRY